jgi:DMSO/TMAO reductase YedYZ molybdopterin-dependent catalytic subunit
VRVTTLITRRRLIRSGLAAAGGLSAFAVAARLADRYGLIPPDHQGVFGAGETLTYASQRILMARHPLAREFARSQISRVAPVNGEPPTSDAYQRLLAGRFAEWKLVVDGLVARPSAFTLADLKRLPSRSQITHQACEEGWSFIAEWIGVPLAEILTRVGVGAGARYVAFFPYDDSWDSLDLAEAWHPQTLLAYGMNGAELPTGHGAPVRLRVPRQLGYKSVKYLSRIAVVGTLADIGAGLGSFSPEVGYSWYAGI